MFGTRLLELWKEGPRYDDQFQNWRNHLTTLMEGKDRRLSYFYSGNPGCTQEGKQHQVCAKLEEEFKWKYQAPYVQNRAIDAYFELPAGSQIWVQHKTVREDGKFKFDNKAPYAGVGVFFIVGKRQEPRVRCPRCTSP